MNQGSDIPASQLGSEVGTLSPLAKIISLEKLHERYSHTWATPTGETENDVVRLLRENKWGMFQGKIVPFTMTLGISGHLVPSCLQLSHVPSCCLLKKTITIVI